MLIQMNAGLSWHHAAIKLMDFMHGLRNVEKLDAGENTLKDSAVCYAKTLRSPK